MSISQIQGDGGVNPLKEQLVNQVSKNGTSHDKKTSENSGGDRVEISAQAKLYQEVDKYKAEIDSVPSPSQGRLHELQESIASGTYMTDDVIAETAGRIAGQILP